VEGALNQHFPFGLAAGVGGYFYQQITGDSGSGATLGPFRGRVAGVGPLLSYTVKVDKQEVTLSGRWFHEFDVKIEFEVMRYLPRSVSSFRERAGPAAAWVHQNSSSPRAKSR
jgi:Putative MetA-pathway of phenol degradation